MSDLRVMFFANGLTCAFQDEQQVPELQESWLILYVQFLESKGIDPLRVVFLMPDGRRQKLFKTEDGEWNWGEAR